MEECSEGRMGGERKEKKWRRWLSVLACTQKSKRLTTLRDGRMRYGRFDWWERYQPLLSQEERGFYSSMIGCLLLACGAFPQRQVLIDIKELHMQLLQISYRHMI